VPPFQHTQGGAQRLAAVTARYPGRCPGLACFAPVGL